MAFVARPKFAEEENGCERYSFFFFFIVYCGGGVCDRDFVKKEEVVLYVGLGVICFEKQQ